MTGKVKNTVKKRPTIKDIARLVGVHHSTVSRAFNPRSDSQISPEVVKKVQNAAKKLGYYPNIVAASLKQNHSFKDSRY
jgi:LacI family transcriptional regulator